MKRNDLIIIGFIALFTAVITYVAANAYLSNTTQKTTTAPKVERITSEIVEPNPEIFNTNAINPTVQISIDGEQIQGQ